MIIPTSHRALPAEGSNNIIMPPPFPNLFTSKQFLLNPVDPTDCLVVFGLADLEHTLHKITADTWIIRIAKMLLNSLLQRLDTTPEFLVVVG